MNRREWLKCVSALAAGVVAGPSLLATFEAHAAAQSPGWAPQFFSKPQIDLMSAVVDIILPRSGTPGALDAGAPAFIDQMFQSVYTKPEQDRYLASLASFDRAGSKPFLQLDATQRKALVGKLHAQALASKQEATMDPAADFVLMTKKLTMMGFFLSEPGCTQVLQYAAVPGGYQADVPLAKAGNGKAWAVETALTL